MKVKVGLSIGLVGCVIEDVLEIEDGASDDDIEEMAREYVNERVAWYWERQ